MSIYHEPLISLRNQHRWTHWKLINCRLSADVHFHGKKKTHTQNLWWITEKVEKTFNRKSLCLHLFIHKSTRQKKSSFNSLTKRSVFFVVAVAVSIYSVFFSWFHLKQWWHYSLTYATNNDEIKQHKLD